MGGAGVRFGDCLEAILVSPTTLIPLLSGADRLGGPDNLILEKLDVEVVFQISLMFGVS
jgi:hypothetical protein